jgi:hypothetical protein
VKRCLFAAYGSERKGVCLRWVVMARQLHEKRRFQLRSAHLAAKCGDMSRISLLGRHWVTSFYVKTYIHTYLLYILKYIYVYMYVYMYAHI